MKNSITELVFILDRSGSMSGLEGDTIGGFNAMIEKQKRQSGEVFVSTILFDSCCNVLHDRMPLSEIGPMTEKDYYVQGCTALLDAMGETIHHIGNIHKYIRAEDIPARTMFVIMTDGMENVSHKYDLGTVRSMIEERKKDGWEFLFIGANIDAVSTATSFGIAENNAVRYHADSAGTETVYAALSETVSKLRRDRQLDRNWGDKIKEDYKYRKKK